jgi:two-component system, sensor histidine kinase PdtaS
MEMALKHSFPNGRDRELSLNLRSEEGKVMLSIRDNGKGLPDDFDIQKVRSMGSMLVSNLVKQVKRCVDIKYLYRTEFNITVPI